MTRVGRNSLSVLVLFLCSLLLSSIVDGFDGVGVPFSANVVRKVAGSDKKRRVGKIFVGPYAIRTEGEQDGEPVVMIFKVDKKRVWMLFPNRKAYVTLPRNVQMPPLPESPESPCQTQKTVSCVRLGWDILQGRRTLKWRVRAHEKSNAGKPLPGHDLLWVDPRLNVIIREEHRDGSVAYMDTIREGMPSKELFVIPKEFEKVEFSDLAGAK